MARLKNAELEGRAAEQGRVALQRLLLRTQMSQAELAECFTQAGHPIQPRSMRRDLRCLSLDEPLDARRAALYVALSEFFENFVVAPAMFAGLRRLDRSFRDAIESVSLSALLEERIDAFAGIGRLPDRVVRWFEDPALEGSISIGLMPADDGEDYAPSGPHGRIGLFAGRPYRLVPLSDLEALYWRIAPGAFPRTEQELAAAFLPSLQRHLIRNFIAGLYNAAKARASRRSSSATRHLERRIGNFPKIPYFASQLAQHQAAGAYDSPLRPAAHNLIRSAAAFGHYRLPPTEIALSVGEKIIVQYLISDAVEAPTPRGLKAMESDVAALLEFVL